MSLSLRFKDDTSAAAPTLYLDSLMQLAGEASPALASSLSAFGECSIGSFLDSNQCC